MLFGGILGIIWDKAVDYVSGEVLDHAKELGIVIELLYAVMTSVMQSCDIWLNRAFKKYVQHKYYEYKNSLGYSTGEKVNVPSLREQIISWIEQAIAHLNEKQRRIDSQGSHQFLPNADFIPMIRRKMPLQLTSKIYVRIIV